MNVNDAIRKLNEIDSLSDRIQDYMNMAQRREISDKEALKILLAHYHFLDPCCFILFCHDTGLNEKITYEEYAGIMAQKAKKARNTKLLQYAESALIIARQLKI